MYTMLDCVHLSVFSQDIYSLQPSTTLQHCLKVFTVFCVTLISHSGNYWIDPNGGIPNDAFEVYCDFTTNYTCIYPNQHKVRGTLSLFP